MGSSSADQMFQTTDFAPKPAFSGIFYLLRLSWYLKKLQFFKNVAKMLSWITEQNVADPQKNVPGTEDPKGRSSTQIKTTTGADCFPETIREGLQKQKEPSKATPPSTPQYKDIQKWRKVLFSGGWMVVDVLQEAFFTPWYHLPKSLWGNTWIRQTKESFRVDQRERRRSCSLYGVFCLDPFISVLFFCFYLCVVCSNAFN